MSDESRLRAEYLASDYPSGSAGYRRFFVDRITNLEQQLSTLQGAVREFFDVHDACSTETLVSLLRNMEVGDE